MTFEELYLIINSRKVQPKTYSYTSSLFKAGLDAMAQKVGEEAVEVVIAAKNRVESKIVAEMVDLFYHLLVLLAYYDIPLQRIYEELEKRKK